VQINEKIFVAGSTGAVGRVLCQLLVQAGYRVFGMTRKKEKSELLQSLNVEPVIMDVYDQDNLSKSLRKIEPNVVFHQLTDLPFGLPKEKMTQGRIDNEKIRDVGTRNLVASATEAKAKRIIAQSICFVYEPGDKPFLESSPLASIALREFENQILNANSEGIVLRYGLFYGPHTGFERPVQKNSVHVDAAAFAGLLAITHGKRGIYNIAENNGEVSIIKALSELKWNPEFRMESPDR
jgi:nucleoside-diphosphate-sugar epimerase